MRPVRYYHVDVTERYGNLSISGSAGVYTTCNCIKEVKRRKKRGVVYEECGCENLLIKNLHTNGVVS
jgi:hypothetical protein